MLRFHDVNHLVDRDTPAELNVRLPDMPDIKILHRLDTLCFDSGVPGCHANRRTISSFPVAGASCHHLAAIDNLPSLSLAADTALSAFASSSMGLLYVGGPSWLWGLSFFGPVGLTAAALTGAGVGLAQRM